MMYALLLSCNREVKKGELLEIPVDIDQNFSLPLSEIADEIIAINPELTDESLVNPDRIQSVLYFEDNVIIAESDKILVFNRDGKFVRAIGSKGQGPGEFLGVYGIALDKNNKHLYVNSFSRKIICYDLTTGGYLKESTEIGSIKYINYMNDELLLLSEQSENDDNGYYKLSVLYHLNNELQITDSVIIRKNYFVGQAFRTGFNIDCILFCNSNLYVYSPEIIPNMPGIPIQFQTIPTELVLRDTLYRFEYNQLIPELKLKFKDNGISSGNMFINLSNIYRSSRYVFAVYNNQRKGNMYYFCYDIKTGKSYNMQDGYTDDIHQIETQLKIRPLNTNTEMFYYWHTHIKPDDLEEPNPTIYIGTLKK